MGTTPHGAVGSHSPESHWHREQHGSMSLVHLSDGLCVGNPQSGCGEREEKDEEWKVPRPCGTIWPFRGIVSAGFVQSCPRVHNTLPASFGEMIPLCMEALT